MLMYEALHRDIAVKAWCRICNDDKQKLEEANLVFGISLGLRFRVCVILYLTRFRIYYIRCECGYIYSSSDLGYISLSFECGALKMLDSSQHGSSVAIFTTTRI